RALEMLSKAAGCGVCRIRDKYLMLPLPTGAELIQQIGDAWKALRKFRAQLSISEWNGAQWLKSEHQLQFIAPDRLRIDVTTDDGQSQVWLMHGHETLQLLPALRIAERWYENRSTDWLSMFGGPANVAGFGQAWEAVVERYRPKSVAVDVIRNTPVYILTLQCAKPRKRLVLEFADTGVVGLGFVYSPYLRDVEVEPATVRLAFDVNTKALVWRGHFRRDDRLINYATATTVKTISNEMPICKHYRIYDSAGTMLTECTYEFAKPGGASEDAWDIAPPPNTIIVDADLGGVRDYESKLKQKEDAHTHFNLARLYQLRLGDLNTALAHIESAMKILPRAPQLWWTAAQIYASAYRPEQAEEALQQLLKFSPDFPGAQSMLAETLAVQGKLNEAITTIERALANAKGASLSRLLLQEATYYEALGRLEEARKLHLRILDTHPIDVDAGITATDKLFTIAWANGDWDGLIREVSALRNANQNPYVQMLLMRIAFERGNIKLAMKHLRAVERVAVDNLPVRLRL
ncbi:MAG TPA: tetratricopeptide repeat protein, partial [Armatimonadetes bacterium]|nr:tetratricopeptide repeat protein [Armatimonadota bacterium]